MVTQIRVIATERERTDRFETFMAHERLANDLDMGEWEMLRAEEKKIIAKNVKQFTEN